MMSNNVNRRDTLRIFNIEENGDWNLIQETVFKPSLWMRLKKRLGLCKFAGDRITNAGLAFAADLLIDNLHYISVGESGTTTGQDAFTDLQSPILTRSLATKSLKTTYVTDDTAVFTGIFVSDGSHTIRECGLHTTITGGTMFARQTNCDITTTVGQAFGYVWEIANTR